MKKPRPLTNKSKKSSDNYSMKASKKRNDVLNSSEKYVAIRKANRKRHKKKTDTNIKMKSNKFNPHY